MIALYLLAAQALTPEQGLAAYTIADKAWAVCLWGAAQRWTAQNEPAETIADASFSHCGAEQESVRLAMADWLVARGMKWAIPRELDSLFAEQLHNKRQLITGMVLDARARR